MAENIWTAWLEEEPNILYQALMPQGKGTPFADYYRSRYGDTYSGYTGQLGRMALSGQDPTLTFTDYLKNFDPYRDWQLQSPGDRGEYVPHSLFWNVG